MRQFLSRLLSSRVSKVVVLVVDLVLFQIRRPVDTRSILYALNNVKKNSHA